MDALIHGLRSDAPPKQSQTRLRREEMDQYPLFGLAL
jgi:hypothetical protein